MTYIIHVANKKTEKRILDYAKIRNDIQEKIEKLKEEPRRANGAHPLHGKLSRKWACWLGSNIRLIYNINDADKIVYIEAIGTHKLY